MNKVIISNVGAINWEEYGISGLAAVYAVPARLNESYVDLWSFGVSALSANTQSFSLLLSADELVRSKKYLHEKDRLRFMVSRGILRMLLGGYLQVAPDSLKFHVGENKKPHLNFIGPAPYYNVAHSGDRVLIAISSHQVGVDIELINTDFNYIDLLPICFSNEEVQDIGNSQSPQIRFFELWTRKEALLKATGRGIDDQMPLAPCVDGQHYPTIISSSAPIDWVVNSFNVSNYFGSVAFERNCKGLRFFRIEGW